MPRLARTTGAGLTTRLTASNTSSSAPPERNAAWPSAAKGSALPWPKRCSRSGGSSAWRTANRLTVEATTSSEESTRLDSIATEPVASQAANLIRTRTVDTATEAWVARVLRRCVGVDAHGNRLATPDVAVAHEYQPVVQPRRAVLPEFDPLRPHPEPRPEIRPQKLRSDRRNGG